VPADYFSFSTSFIGQGRSKYTTVIRPAECVKAKSANTGHLFLVAPLALLPGHHLPDSYSPHPFPATLGIPKYDLPAGAITGVSYLSSALVEAFTLRNRLATSLTYIVAI
jgi:hypothetical protein